jgi:hypothetical protein
VQQHDQRRRLLFGDAVRYQQVVLAIALAGFHDLLLDLRGGCRKGEDDQKKSERCRTGWEHT